MAYQSVTLCKFELEQYFSVQKLVVNVIARCVHHFLSKWNRILTEGHFSYFISFKYHTYDALKYMLLKNYCNAHLQLITSTFCLQHAYSVKQQTACHVETKDKPC